MTLSDLKIFYKAITIKQYDTGIKMNSKRSAEWSRQSQNKFMVH